MDKVYETANIVEKAIGKAHQIAAREFRKSPVKIPADFRGVSFCFDDFPVSAGEYGAKALEDAGARGMFYTCFGLLETENQGGRLASADQVISLAGNGHEIGCHTYDHINCSFVDAGKVEASCRKNREAALINDLRLDHFSYPQGGMTLSAKKIIQTYYKTARSGFQGINAGICDMHCLKSVPFYETHSEKIYSLLDQVDEEGGWLLLYTHDISNVPSEHGVSETLFRNVLARCFKKRLPVRTVGEATEILRAA